MRRRKRSRGQRRPTFSIPQILTWADEFYNRHGRWPTPLTGRIVGTMGEKWRNVDSALRIGLRGLEGGTSLPRLLAEARGVRNQTNLPRLNVPMILGWADAHRARTGTWPKETSGLIPESTGDTWFAVDRALRAGVRGFPGRSSLPQILTRFRSARNIQRLPRYSIKQILGWADEHYERTGRWPNNSSGPVHEVPGETWSAVNTALKLGRRGLPTGSSLPQLLDKHRGVRNLKQLPRMTTLEILEWIVSHRQRTGQWPHRRSGFVAEAPQETWSIVDRALKERLRGVERRTSLVRLVRRCQRQRLELATAEM
jgi:hypothetical protein